MQVRILKLGLERNWARITSNGVQILVSEAGPIILIRLRRTIRKIDKKFPPKNFEHLKDIDHLDRLDDNLFRFVSHFY